MSEDEGDLKPRGIAEVMVFSVCSLWQHYKHIFSMLIYTGGHGRNMSGVVLH